MERKKETEFSPARSEAEYLPQYEDDTISLVDLVAVVIRHRSLIVLGTLLVGVLTAAVLYFGPMAGLDVGPTPEYTVQRRISVDPLPSELRGVVSITPSTELRAILTDIGVVGHAYRRVEREPDGDLTEGRRNVAIRRFAAEKYSVSWSGETETMTVSVTTDDPAYGADFLEAVIAEAGTAVTARINTRLEEQRQTLETNLAATRAELERLALQAAERVSPSPLGVTPTSVLGQLDVGGGTAIVSLFQMERASAALDDISGSAETLYRVEPGTILFEEQTGSGRTTIVIITTITTFFLTVFLAFVLEYIRRVRQEPEEMAKIEAAWRRL
jgi:hypothetical protein